jgi:hypothetical protein
LRETVENLMRAAVSESSFDRAQELEQMVWWCTLHLLW